MARAAVVGVGMTKFGPHQSPLPHLFAEAAFPAMDDAGVDAGDIDALYLGNFIGGAAENETHIGPKVASHIGLSGVPCQRFEDACATSMNAFKHAVRSIESGYNDLVLVGGVERCTTETGLETPEMTDLFISAADRQHEQPTGVTFPGVFAAATKRHMYEYGTTEEQLAQVSVKNHSNGDLNPRAHFGQQITVDDVLDSPLIADPFHLFDCCPFSDGASAVVLASSEAADSFNEPVDVTGIGHASDVIPLADKSSLTETKSARVAAAQAYDQSGITPADIDFCEVHDCFTGAEILAIEALDLFPDGEAGPATAEGKTALDGEIPINPSGGLKAKGHPIGATGTAMVVELTEQIRHNCGKRQVKDAEVGLAHNLGGDFGTTLVTVMEARP